MYPDLSYLFHEIFGTSPDNWTSIFKTFGVLLVLALTACGVFLKFELQQKEKEGLILPQKITATISEKMTIIDIVINAFFSLVIGAKLPSIIMNFELFKADPANFIFSKKGEWLIGAAAAIATIAYYIYKNLKADPNPKIIETTYYPSEKTNDIVIIAGLSGVLGSKLFSVTEDLPGFFKDPLGTLLSGSGLNVFGGLILAFIAVLWYVKKIGIKPLYMMDIGGMGILLGYALGRIGCQLSGDGDWGIEAVAQPSWWFLPDWVWSYNYPNNVNNDGILMAHADPEIFKTAYSSGLTVEESCFKSSGVRYCHELLPKVYPTPIYETLFSLLAFTILFINKHHFKIPGLIFFTYMIINGVERFFIEMIRVNERYDLFGLHWSQAQYIAILFIIVGVTGIVYLTKNNKEKLT